MRRRVFIKLREILASLISGAWIFSDDARVDPQGDSFWNQKKFSTGMAR
jgi:hypothetical protein